jgi:glyoxylase-like metal-dependent hydrolase (beta-lactamase superfamily II)
MQQIAKGVYVETEYPGVNVGAIVGRRGIVCVDVPTYPRDARHWAGRMRQLSRDPVQYVILTDHHGDRILNTRWLNAPIIAHERAAERMAAYDKRYPQALIDSVASRNVEQSKELATGPVDRVTMSFSEEMTLVVDERRVCLLAKPGPTSATVWVHLPDDGILFAGDSLVVDTHPILAEAQCGPWLSSLEALRQANREYRSVVPGRGPIASRGAVEDIIAYLRQVQNLASTHHTLGRSRDELNEYVGELLPRFPLNGLPREWVTRQIRLGLNHIYDEMKESVTAQEC